MDYSNLDNDEIKNIKDAIEFDGDFYGYIPDKGFQFILDNFTELSKLKVLEVNWMNAYLHAVDFSKVPLERLWEIFEACNKEILQKEFPIYTDNHFNHKNRFSLFRGCAGNNHRMGMSWTCSLDKAIWYAAKHKEYNNLDNVAVYASVVDVSEIYCCGHHYDHDFIVLPKNAWRIEIPEEEFRLDRPR